MQRFLAEPVSGRYGYAGDLTHTLMKVETHNHPTAISPFPGAATGVGRRDPRRGRDRPRRQAEGRPRAASRSRTCGSPAPSGRGRARSRSPDRIASPLAIMIEGPIGAAVLQQRVRPAQPRRLLPRYEQEVDGRRARLPQADHARGRRRQRARRARAEGRRAARARSSSSSAGPGCSSAWAAARRPRMSTGANTARPRLRLRPARQRRDPAPRAGGDRPLLGARRATTRSSRSTTWARAASRTRCRSSRTARGRGARIDLRAAPSEEPGMTPREVWSNEAQERYVLAIAPGRPRAIPRALRARALPVRGRRHRDRRRPARGARPALRQQARGHGPAGAPRQAAADDARRGARQRPQLRAVPRPTGIELAEAVRRVLLHPTVADKTFLVTIGDRTRGRPVRRATRWWGRGRCPSPTARRRCCPSRATPARPSPIGERAPIAVIDAPASGRMAVGEALTNLAAAPVASLSRVKLSANWMAAAGSPGEDAALFDTVSAVALELCPKLGIGIPVGKDSMSMRTTWEEGGEPREVRVAAVARRLGLRPLPRRARRPGRRSCAPTAARPSSCFVDLAGGRTRLGGSILAQVFGQTGHEAPDLDDPRADPGALRRARRAARRRASCSPTTTARTAGSSRRSPRWPSPGTRGSTSTSRALAGPRADAAAASSPRSSTRSWACVLQCDSGRAASASLAILARHGLGALRPRRPERRRRGARSRCGDRVLLAEPRSALQRLWSETTWRMQTLRDNPESARAGVRPHPGRARPRPLAAPHLRPGRGRGRARSSRGGARPRIAILREQGVNGQVEMAAAFDRAGFEAIDVHMSDVIAGRVSLAELRGLRGLRRLLLRRRAGRRRGLGASRSCSTRGRATSSPPSSPAPTASRSASATAAR